MGPPWGGSGDEAGATWGRAFTRGRRARGTRQRPGSGCKGGVPRLSPAWGRRGGVNIPWGWSWGWWQGGDTHGCSPVGFGDGRGWLGSPGWPRGGTGPRAITPPMSLHPCATRPCASGSATIPEGTKTRGGGSLNCPRVPHVPAVPPTPPSNPPWPSSARLLREGSGVFLEKWGSGVSLPVPPPKKKEPPGPRVGGRSLVPGLQLGFFVMSCSIFGGGCAAC